MPIYRKVTVSYWDGELAEANRGDTDAHAVAFYLMTCPGTNQIGVYRLALPTLCDAVGIDTRRASEALRKLSERGFCVYDERFRMVFVREYARHEYGERPNVADNRVKGLMDALPELLAVCRKSFVWQDFWDRYGVPWAGVLTKCEPPDPEAIRKPSGSPSGRVPYQDQDQDQDQDQESPPIPPAGGSTVPRKPPAPAWAAKAAKGSGYSARQVSEAICRCIEAVTLAAVDPARSRTAAAPILALWRAEGRYDPGDFEANFRLVAEAAHRSSDRMFARDIRAEGWSDGVDRSFDPSTIAVQKRWTERLARAKLWAAEQGRRSPEKRSGPEAGSPGEPPRAIDCPAWDAVLAKAEAELDSEELLTWFLPLVPTTNGAQEIEVWAPSEHFAHVLSASYGHLLEGVRIKTGKEGARNETSH